MIVLSYLQQQKSKERWKKIGSTRKIRRKYRIFAFSHSLRSVCTEGRLNSTAYVAFLRRVLAHTTQPILLMQDGARYHTSAETTAFFAQQTVQLQVFQLPTYAPDDNPIEKRWKKIKQQETHLHYFPTFEALTEKVEQALRKFANIPEAMRALCSLPIDLAQAA